MQDRAAAADWLPQLVTVRRGIEVTYAVAVDGPEQHHQSGEFEQGLALRLGGGTELQAGRILKHEQQRHLALLDEFLPVGFSEARRDVPVNIAHIVAELVFHDLVEFHAATAEGRAVFAAEHIFNSVAHAPLQPAKQGKGGTAGRLNG